MKKYRTTSNPSMLYGFDKNKKLVAVKKIKAGMKFFGNPAQVMIGQKPLSMVSVLNPNKKFIVGFFNEKDVEKILSAEGDAPKAKTFVQNLTSPEVLWTAGGGALLGFVLGQLVGASKIGLTAGGAALGGLIGFSGSSSEKTMSAEGRPKQLRPSGRPKPSSASAGLGGGSPAGLASCEAGGLTFSHGQVSGSHICKDGTWTPL